VVWVDDRPVGVRHYADAWSLKPTRSDFDLVTLVVATRAVAAADVGMQPEHADIIRLARNPVRVNRRATRPATRYMQCHDLLDRGLIERPPPGVPFPPSAYFAVSMAYEPSTPHRTEDHH
jgi:hypothetical protein